MREGLFVTGTDTGVGKTAVTAALVAALRQRGLPAAAMKPVETGHACSSVLQGDAAILGEASGGGVEPGLLNPYCFLEPLAPSVAAGLENVEIEPARIISACWKLRDRFSPLLVEGAGGLAVPLRDNYLMADLARDLRLPLLVVGRTALGTINHTFLTVAYARQVGLEVAGVVLSHAGPAGLAAETSPGIIRSLTGLPLWELPYQPAFPAVLPPIPNGLLEEVFGI